MMPEFKAAARHEIDSAAVTDLMDEGIVAARSADTPRDYLGMSRVGEECQRKLYYEYRHTKKDMGKDFSGRTLRIFQRGHDCETRMAKYLRDAGFELLTETANGGQFAVRMAKDPDTGTYRLAGHADGIITGWQRGMRQVSQNTLEWIERQKFPMLWENKGVGSKSFKKYQANGIREANPVYYTQMQLYMAYLELSSAMFTAENQDTCEIYAEVIDFNPRAAQEASDKGVRIVTAHSASELPRCANTETDYRCRMCEYAITCWADKTVPAAPAARPSWLAR